MHYLLRILESSSGAGLFGGLSGSNARGTAGGLFSGPKLPTASGSRGLFGLSFAASNPLSSGNADDTPEEPRFEIENSDELAEPSKAEQPTKPMEQPIGGLFIPPASAQAQTSYFSGFRKVENSTQAVNDRQALSAAGSTSLGQGEVFVKPPTNKLNGQAAHIAFKMPTADAPQGSPSLFENLSRDFCQNESSIKPQPSLFSGGKQFEQTSLFTGASSSSKGPPNMFTAGKPAVFPSALQPPNDKLHEPSSLFANTESSKPSSSIFSGLKPSEPSGLFTNSPKAPPDAPSKPSSSMFSPSVTSKVPAQKSLFVQPGLFTNDASNKKPNQRLFRGPGLFSPQKTSEAATQPDLITAVKLSGLPAEVNHRAQLTKLFTRFGKIERIICQPNVDTALIAFSSLVS